MACPKALPLGLRTFAKEGCGRGRKRAWRCS